MQHEPGSVGRWLQYARGDMTMAEQPMSADVPYLLRCFHAQQAAEKSVKAVLLHLGVAFPPTHNLSVLFALLPEDAPPPLGLAQDRTRSEWSQYGNKIRRKGLCGKHVRMMTNRERDGEGDVGPRR